MRVVITGGSGFVGLALADAVLRSGGSTVLFADRPPPERMLRALPGGGAEDGGSPDSGSPDSGAPGSGARTWVGDVRDRAAAAGCLAAVRPDALVHAAAADHLAWFRAHGTGA